MSFYRKKPVVIEAIQWDGSMDNMEAINAHWPELRTTHLSGYKHSRTVHEWGIGTLEGYHRVSVGDYIIKGVRGEFYPCKPDIFELTYEANDALRTALTEALSAQPVREPLSYEQIRNLSYLPECMDGDYLQVYPFARAIERAHGIGGDK